MLYQLTNGERFTNLVTAEKRRHELGLQGTRITPLKEPNEKEAYLQELIKQIESNCTKLQITYTRNGISIFKCYGSATYHIIALKNGYFRCNIQDVNGKGKKPKGKTTEQIIVEINELFPKPKQ